MAFGVLILNCGAKGVQCIIKQCYIVIVLDNKLGLASGVFFFCYTEKNNK